MKKKVLICFGTRPEAIKMAPLIKAFYRNLDKFHIWVCVTGQHREMLDQVLHIFEIVPDFDLDIMQKGQDLYDVTSKVLLGLRDVLSATQPDLVLVHGDTMTSVTAALAAFYKQVPVGHVEAGLRTFNRYSPWPEEINRQLTGRLATFHFAPTIVAKANLLRENVEENKIIVTGNTVIDALHDALKRINAAPDIKTDLECSIQEKGYELNRLQTGQRLILITGHRRENFGDGFVQICQALRKLAKKYPTVDFVYPVHLNPNVQTPVREALSEVINKNVFLISPLEYLPFVYLMEKSYLILTDSGGIQEEAPGLGKPVLVMRDTTERPEAVAAGTVKLVGANTENIAFSVSELLDNVDEYRKMAEANNPYGDGHASERIVDFLTNVSFEV